MSTPDITGTILHQRTKRGQLCHSQINEVDENLDNDCGGDENDDIQYICYKGQRKHVSRERKPWDAELGVYVVHDLSVT